MTLLIGCAALGVDIGSIFADRRRAQSATDLAAIVAAGNLNNATRAATATVVGESLPGQCPQLRNSRHLYRRSGHLAAGTLRDTGHWHRKCGTRFLDDADAALFRTLLHRQKPIHDHDQCDRFLHGNGFICDRHTIAFGNGGLINALLGGMLGTNLSLQAMDYQSLINTKIDALDFLNALATRVNLTGATYGSVLDSNVKVADFIAAALTTQQVTNGASTATTALSSIS